MYTPGDEKYMMNFSFDTRCLAWSDSISSVEHREVVLVVLALSGFCLWYAKQLPIFNEQKKKKESHTKMDEMVSSGDIIFLSMLV